MKRVALSREERAHADAAGRSMRPPSTRSSSDVPGKRSRREVGTASRCVDEFANRREAFDARARARTSGCRSTRHRGGACSRTRTSRPGRRAAAASNARLISAARPRRPSSANGAPVNSARASNAASMPSAAAGRDDDGRRHRAARFVQSARGRRGDAERVAHRFALQSRARAPRRWPRRAARRCRAYPSRARDVRPERAFDAHRDLGTGDDRIEHRRAGGIDALADGERRAHHRRRQRRIVAHRERRSGTPRAAASSSGHGRSRARACAPDPAHRQRRSRRVPRRAFARARSKRVEHDRARRRAHGFAEGPAVGCKSDQVGSR